MTSIDGLLGALRKVPSLPGAACRHKSHLFNEAEPNEPAEQVQQRHTQARQLCAGCPSLKPCGDWLATLSTPSRRPTGIVAGRLVTAPQPRKRSAT